MLSKNLEEFLSKKMIIEQTGFSISTLDRLVRARMFPKPIRLSPNRVAFRRSEVEAWQANPDGWRFSKRADQRAA
jgi:predicted DNA-binding transcriptional regulator AlpA